jgi:hypothetical protein
LKFWLNDVKHCRSWSLIGEICHNEVSLAGGGNEIGEEFE